MEDDRQDLTKAEIRALAQRIDRSIVLVGLMGVGKTSVGRKLAAMLDYAFVDADEEIERAAALTIPEIFERHGEAEFRDGERRVIARLMEDQGGRRIIATGGGAFCNDETRAIILQKGLAVWLDSDIDTLVHRTSRKNTRPLLQRGDPRQILTELREARAPFYAQAPIHVISNDSPLMATAEAVLRKIEAWL